MQSKTSYFNKTLFRKNLTRFWPLWGGASALGALAPLALLVYHLQRLTPAEADPLGAASMLYGVLSSAVPILSLLYAVLCAMAVWSYLFSARSVGLMHTLPVTRAGLFVTNCLSGLAMMLIPYAVTGVLAVLVLFLEKSFTPVGVLVTVLGVLGESLFYFATATFAAFCTGNLFAMGALYFIFHFLAAAVEWMLTSFFSVFYYGVEDTVRNLAGPLCPTEYLLRHVTCVSEYADVLTPLGYPARELSSVTLSGGWIIGVYALIGLVILAACWALYARRRSESAGDVVAVGWMKPIFRYGAAFCAAIPGGLALYLLFWQGFQKGARAEALPMALAAALAGVVGYYIASMLLAKSFKVFRACWKGAAAVAVFCVLLCGITSLDPLGVESRLPAAEEVGGVWVTLNAEGYCTARVKDPAAIREVLAAHGAIIAQRDDLQLTTGSDRWRGTTDWTTTGSAYVSLVYSLQDGSQFRRSYTFTYPYTDVDRSGTAVSVLSQLATYPALQQDNIFGSEDGESNVVLTGGSVSDLYNAAVEIPSGVSPENSLVRASLDASAARTLYEAVQRDIQAGHFGRTLFRWPTEDVTYYTDIDLYYTYEFTGSQGETIPDTGSDNIRFSTYCTETIAALKSLGVTGGDLRLLTEAEWDHMMNPEEDQKYEKYGGISVPMDTEASSEAVIGGADGPTEIFITGG